MRTTDGPVKKSTILEKANITNGMWRRASLGLLESGEVEMRGKTKFARYHYVGKGASV